VDAIPTALRFTVLESQSFRWASKTAFIIYENFSAYLLVSILGGHHIDASKL